MPYSFSMVSYPSCPARWPCSRSRPYRRAKQWTLDTQKDRRNLDKWELGKIALRLKPDIESKDRANQSAGGQAFRPSEAAKEGLTTLADFQLCGNLDRGSVAPLITPFPVSAPRLGEKAMQKKVK